MDDITRKRLEAEAEEQAQFVTEGISHLADTLPGSPAHNAELVKLGLPVERNSGVAMTLIGFPIGNMISVEGCTIERVHAILAAVAYVPEVSAYDVCEDEAVAQKLDYLVANWPGVSLAKVYQWARLFRVAINELVIALEDYHHVDVANFPTEKLRDTAFSIARFMVDTLVPVFRAHMAPPSEPA